MTMHSAKGLEFNNVYIAGAEEEIFPRKCQWIHPRNWKKKGDLFYVAITRSTKTGVISYAQNRYRWGTLTFSSPAVFCAILIRFLLTGLRKKITKASEYNTHKNNSSLSVQGQCIKKADSPASREHCFR